MGDQAQSGGGSEPLYRAFISYSHTDAGFAQRLHRRLERMRLPSPPGQPRERLAPVFIDRAELAAGSDLTAQVREALAASAALVVVASPAARASRWVAQEIALFRQIHPHRPVLAALIDGEPGEAFPDALLHAAEGAIEPLAADFRKGRDGERLGLLKLAAGLTALPLDRLVQRDAQARQRRVMAVTAASLLLSLVLAALLVFALRARAEAERQRGEAEGLVEFMLTDLRDKLKGVGRLDVMDAVNERAMAHYAGQRDLPSLPPESLYRRARVIEAMGEDDESRGNTVSAYDKYRELHRTTASLLASDPDNPERIFAHAGSENRLALIQTTRGNLEEARSRFANAEALLDRLPPGQDKPEWADLRSLVVGNLCAITLKSGGKAKSALDHCRAAVRIALAQVDGPDGAKARYALAFHYLWLGDAAAAAGDPVLARQARADGLAISDQLIAREPDNWMWLEQHAEILLYHARLSHRHGQIASARALLARAHADVARLVRHDPGNGYWADLGTQADQLGKEIAR